MSRKRVLISGAGLAGLALYQILDKKQFEVDLIEKYGGFVNLGYAVIFMPNGVCALRELGYSPAQIKKLGKPVQEFRTLDLSGKVSAISNLVPLAKKYDHYLLVKRQDLHSLLERNVSKKNIRFNTQIKNLKQTVRGVEVCFVGDRKSHVYDLVVGADGIHSGVRKQIFPESHPKSRNVWVVWSWLPRSVVTLNNNILAFDSGEYGFGFFDITGAKRVCGFLYATKKVLPTLLPREEYPPLWEKYSAKFNSKLLAQKLSPKVADIYAHEDRTLRLRNWHKGSVVLIGDAAHAKSVFTGSGTALALEDAVYLGELLNSGMDVRRAIQTFENVQKPRVRKMVHGVGAEFIKISDAFLSTSPLFNK